MKEKIKNALKCTQLFVKKNKMSCICFLLAVLVTISGTFSFAKYISGDSISKRPGAATMHASSEITGVSALSFTNTDFWGDDGGEDDIAMNSLRSIDISVNNYELAADGVTKNVSDVRMEYEIVFCAPVSFTENLAFQVLAEDGHPITTQMILGHFIESAHNHESHTAEGKARFNGVDVDHDHVFTFESNDDESLIICTTDYMLPEGGTAPLTIRLEKIVETLQQTLLFRAWDTSELNLEKVETEMGDLLPPVRAVIETEVPMYKISIHLPTFVFEPGTEQTANYRITIAPTEVLADVHLGAVMSPTDSNIKAIYAGLPVSFVTTTETYHYTTDSNYLTTSNWEYIDEVHLIANPAVYTVGEVLDIRDLKPQILPVVEENITVNNLSTSQYNDNNTENISSLPTSTQGYYKDGYYYFERSNNTFSTVTAGDTNNYYRIKIVDNATSGTKTTTKTFETTATGNVTTRIESKIAERRVENIAGDFVYISETKNITELSKVFKGNVGYTETETYTLYDLNNNISNRDDVSDYYTIQQCRNGNWRSVSIVNASNSDNNSRINTTTFNNLITALEGCINASSTGTEEKEITLNTAEATATTGYYRITRTLEPGGTAELISVTQTQYPDGGDPYDVAFTEGNPLAFINTTTGYQVVCLSPCYAKDYPLTLRVVFSQIQ